MSEVSLTPLSRIRLSGGIQVFADIDLYRLEDLFQRALAFKRLLEFRGPGGHRFALNPPQILYMENLSALSERPRRPWYERFGIFDRTLPVLSARLEGPHPLRLTAKDLQS